MSQFLIQANCHCSGTLEYVTESTHNPVRLAMVVRCVECTAQFVLETRLVQTRQGSGARRHMKDPTPHPDCGTSAAVSRHRRADERLDPDCARAHREYMTNYRKERAA